MNAARSIAFAQLVLVFFVASAWGEPVARKVGHPSFMSPHSRPILSHQGLVFVANTPADTVDVLETDSGKVKTRISVGVDPVSLAIRPDGKELWVSNHISDSVSVIDIEPDSPTRFLVVATVQDFDPETKATQFDEPMGIAFANNRKAYVALSSENEIAVIDVASRSVAKRLKIPAQDPRAIAVRGDRLYVIPFESNNQTQLSGGRKIDGDLVTFDIWEHSVHHNNVLSLGHVTDIVKHPEVPDRDLFIFDTKTDQLIRSVDSLGTLLYGLTVDSKGRVFIAQTDARNDANGRAGTKKHGLAELGNRAFLNRITRVGSGESDVPVFFDLEPLPPATLDPAKAVATPFAIQVSPDDSTLVLTAASSDKVCLINAETGQQISAIEVGAVPRGIALESDEKGRPVKAWILNAVANTVSQIDLRKLAKPKLVATISLEDPTHAAVKRGRIAFNTARASSTRSFSCASCHPDGHTDQLLWVLKTPIVTGGNQIMPRSTMPIRGLRDTAPFHWDGIPGDPYGGNNSANIQGHSEPNADIENPESAARHLIDGGLASTMLRVGDETKNDEGKSGFLSAAERDDLAKFLLGVTYPPAPRRSYTNVLSNRAEKGFELFHILGNHEGKPQANVCGNCHRMPFWVSTNAADTGMDTPTWRGAYDRWLILPQGRLNVIGLDFFARIADQGIPEREMWKFSWRGKERFDPVWEMVLEGSTGFAGAFARQITVNQKTATQKHTGEFLDALEEASWEGAVVLQVEGKLKGRPVALQFQEGGYAEATSEGNRWPRAALIQSALSGDFIGTFTARHGAGDDYETPQPALWTLSEIHTQSGPQRFPVLFDGKKSMRINARHLQSGASVFVNGRKVEAEVEFLEQEQIRIELAALPGNGMHFIQLQNPAGLFSNDFIFHVAENRQAAAKLKGAALPDHLRKELGEAISAGSATKVKRLIRNGADVVALDEKTGTTPLVVAVFHGNMEIAQQLIKAGASVNQSSRDGNCPLHTAAFFCRRDFVDMLLEKGADPKVKNDRGETPRQTVAGEWSEKLEGVYQYFNRVGSLNLDLAQLPQSRAAMAKRLERFE